MSHLDEPRYSLEVRRVVEVPEYGPLPDDCGKWSAWETLLTHDAERCEDAARSLRRANPRNEYRVVPAPTDRERWFGKKGNA